MSESEFGGASNEERLLAAARSDNEELLLEVFEQPGTFDINCQDGLGNTPLHNAYVVIPVRRNRVVLTIAHLSTIYPRYILSPSFADAPIVLFARCRPSHIGLDDVCGLVLLSTARSSADLGPRTHRRLCFLACDLRFSLQRNPLSRFPFYYLCLSSPSPRFPLLIFSPSPPFSAPTSTACLLRPSSLLPYFPPSLPRLLSHPSHSPYTKPQTLFTPYTNSVLHASTDVLEHILSHDACDVDPLNRLDRATPLHLAVTRLEDKDLRRHVVESLLDAGADTTIRDKNGDTALDLVPLDDEEVITLIRKARAGNAVAKGDIAEDDDDGDVGSGSGSDSE